MQNTAVYVPITFKEIVMIVINTEFTKLKWEVTKKVLNFRDELGNLRRKRKETVATNIINRQRMALKNIA